MKPTLMPYLNFNGNTAEAMKFYQSVLGGELDMQTFAQFGMPISEDKKDQIMHAALKNDTLSFMASDGGDHRQVNMGDNVTLSIIGTDEEVMTKYFNGLSQGGKIEMPLEKQAWGDKYGSFVDKFGIHWAVNIVSAENLKK